MIKAIIFDLDGVLVDAVDWHYLALNRALSIFGHSIPRNEHDMLYNGLPTAVKLDLLSQRRNLPRPLHPFINELKQKYTIQIISSECTPDIKTSTILRRLKALGYQLGVASNCVRASVDLFLKRMSLENCFDIVLSNEDVNRPKPSPEIYQTGISLLGIAPEECLVIEDSLPGIQAAKSSGAHVLIVKGIEEVTLDKILNQISQANSIQTTGESPLIQSEQKPTIEVVIPMAGLGQRFADAGYRKPKPFIELFGKPMIQWVVENIKTQTHSAHFTFICNQQHLVHFDGERLLREIAPGCSIVTLPSTTEGAACTVLLAIDRLHSDRPLLLANSDQWVMSGTENFVKTAESDNVDGLIMTFKAHDKKWSFARLDDNGRVLEVAEKNPISNQATVGIYYFRRVQDFVEAAMSMIRKDIRTNGEFYVCPVYNELIAAGKNIRTFEIGTSDMHGLGTPEDLERFIPWATRNIPACRDFLLPIDRTAPPVAGPINAAELTHENHSPIRTE